MRRVVVGTAGHIDHGKTSLVAALTGIDCDRWVEEKERGITIDIGFAFLREGDLQIGFVDVPGHERFVHNALAGLGGIQTMILVVAADEGVKPQTEEHLAICSLLEIPAGIAVLTKSDLVDPELLELAQLELEEALAGGPFEGAPILAVSSTTGDGIETLKSRLVEIASRIGESEDRLDQPARLPIDRAFHLKGLGALVTGTLASGVLKSGDALELLPGGRMVRSRSIQVHGEERDEARAGERTAIQLAGVELAELARGVQLAAPGGYLTTRRLLARLRLLPGAPAPIRGFTPVRFHLYSSERLGKLRPLDRKQIEPGDTALVEIRLDAPIAAARGDRFVIRRPSPQTTLGGGALLDPQWQRPRGKRLEQALEALGGDDDRALLYWIERAGEAGIEAAPLGQRLARRPGEIADRLRVAVQDQRLVVAAEGRGHGRRWLTPTAYQRIQERAKKVLADYFGNNRLAIGMPKAEAIAAFFPGPGAQLADVYLDWLAKQKVLRVDGEHINPPGRGSGLDNAETQLADRIVEAYEKLGLTPGSPPEIARSLGAKQQIFDGLVRHLTQSGRLVRLPSGLFLAQKAIAQLAADLAATGWKTFTVPEFKDRFGLSRKWAIPLLEYLDSQRLTRRTGDQREVIARSKTEVAVSGQNPMTGH